MLIQIAVGAWTMGALAFANTPIGSEIENISMPSLLGGEHKLLGDAVSVFVFIKPGAAHSHTALAQIVECQKELSGKPVHWTVVVSDRIPRAIAEEEIKSCGLTTPVLIDKGDLLYGKLGVILQPCIGITDERHRLLAYQPFAKVNYRMAITAHIRHALKEITDQQLQEVIAPAASEMGGDKSTAHRFFRLAEKQFKAGNYSQALVSVGKSIERQPTASAYRLRGQVLTIQGNRADALAAFEAALKLDPEDPKALEEKTKQ